MIRIFRAQTLSAALLLICTASLSTAALTNFNNTANVNVLRQYDDLGVFLVPHSSSATGVGIERDAPNDGSGWNVESTNSSTSAGASITQTFTLGDAASVASFRAEWDSGGRAPTTFELRGSTDNFATSDFLLSNSNPSGTQPYNVSFTAATVNAIRYIATGPAFAGDRFGLGELQVFMQTGGTLSKGTGYNFLRDMQLNSETAWSTSGATINNWEPNNGNVADILADGLYYDGGQVKAQNGDGRAWALLTLDAATQTNFGNLGYRKGESMAPWQVYSTNNDTLATSGAINAITDNSIAGMQTAGWTLQYSNTVNSGGPGNFFPFAAPGEWEHFLIVWDIQGGSFTEMELFAVPEPASALLLGVGGLLAFNRLRRRSH